jgi:hypothetical protein
MNIEIESKAEPIGDVDAPNMFSVHDNSGFTLFEVKGWTTSDLVSFGNYMLNRYPTKALDSSTPIMEVTHADFCNWKDAKEQ